MTTIKDIYTYLDALYPRSLSCEWDNDGLMVCENSAIHAKKVLLTLDVTQKVADYAKANGVDLIISHHPLIFKKLRSLSEETLFSQLPINLLSHGISVMSFHTRFDAAEGGMNDTLSAMLGLKTSGSFGPEGEENCGRLCLCDIPFTSLCNRVKATLDAPNICAIKSNENCKKVAVLGGGGGDFIDAAVAAGADTFITGDAGYNAILDAKQKGISMIVAGHYHTEFLPFVTATKKVLAEKFPDIKIEISPIGCEVLYI